MFNHGKCVVHGKRGLVEACHSFSLIECVLHGCDVLNKRESLDSCTRSEERGMALYLENFNSLKQLGSVP